MTEEGNIIVRRAKVNNLKDVTVEIPRGKFVVITGISGSGKSSLAFDTLFAEGQRRFAESLSSYARQFLGRMSKPDVELIEGIPPAIAIEQKVNTRNPRSTIATSTEIYDYLRMIYARIGRTYSPVTGVEVKCHTVQDVLAYIYEKGGSALYILSDLNWSSRTDKVELMLQLKEEGYTRFFTDAPVRIEEVMKKAETGEYPDSLYLLVDRVRDPKPDDEDQKTRLLASVDTAFIKGGGTMYVRCEHSGSGQSETVEFINRFEADGMTFQKPDEYLFSFNSPLGACPVCGGLGKIVGISEDLVVPDKSKTIYDGAIACWRGEKMGWFKDQVVRNSVRYGIPVFEPYCNLSQEVRDMIWKGCPAENEEDSIVGLNEFFKWVEANRYKVQYKYMLSRYSGKTVCQECGGSRLRREALYVKVGGKNIHELLSMNVTELLDFLENISLEENDRKIASKAIEEIISRLKYIQDVGLGYLTLNRTSNTLSGGESQRINLVTALGSSLVGSLYILDEPSIGLHPRAEVCIRLRASQRNLSVFPMESLYAMEHDYMDTTFRSMYLGISAFMDANKERKELLLGQRKPCFDEEILSKNAHFIDDFERVATKAYSAKDYFLLVGPPGTGKTSRALRRMVEKFYANPDTQILLLAYTNRAVDEICSSLETIVPSVDYIRIGSELSCDERYRGRLVENVLAPYDKRKDVRGRLSACRVYVGTVASLSSKPEIFKLKRFDVAIVDEATQILEPQLLWILSAKSPDGRDAVGKFVLIGDHKQLPAVVLQRKEESEVFDEGLRKIGLHNLKDSLFERLYRNHLSEKDSLALDMLCRQGRMHPGVASFPNQAFYNGKLEPVGLSHQLEEIRMPVVFVPSARDTSSLNGKTNADEARMVADWAERIYQESPETFDANRTLGVITPYRSQIAEITVEGPDSAIYDLQEDGNDYVFATDMVGTYILTITSSANDELSMTLTITVKQPPEISTILDGQWQNVGKSQDNNLMISIIYDDNMIVVTYEGIQFDYSTWTPPLRCLRSSASRAAETPINLSFARRLARATVLWFCRST